MKYIYFQVFDISVPYESIEHSLFDKSPFGYDMAGHVASMAYRNKSSISDIRLYIYPSKKAWDEAREEWLKRAKTSEKCK